MSDLDLTVLVGELDAPAQDLWDALQDHGRIEVQRCERCGRCWAPAATECPHCGAREWRPHEVAGTGRLVSWVTFHRPPHPALADLVPYAVGVVALDEGPHLVVTMEEPASGTRADAPVRLEVVERGGVRLVAARPA